MPDPVGTVLAFDFGEKRIGVATGETLLGSAHPLTVIHAESNDDRFAAIGKLIADAQKAVDAAVKKHTKVHDAAQKGKDKIESQLTALAAAPVAKKTAAPAEG